MTIPFSELKTFSALFEAYIQGDERLRPYFAGDFRDDHIWINLSQKVAEHPRDRQQLVTTLLRQNEAWGMDPEARRNIEALADPQSVAVVTGQQLGLFGGPLYTVYKTLTTLQLAASLTQKTGRPVVPVFWLEGEDHDFKEVSYVHMPQGNGWQKWVYEDETWPEHGNLGQVGRLVLQENLQNVLQGIEDALPPTDFKTDLMTRLRAAFQPGRTFQDAFVAVLKQIFPNSGLVFVTPDDAELKRLVAPLFRKEIETPSAILDAMTDSSGRLRQDGFHAQVNPRQLNLFLITENGRYALDADGTDFRLKGQNRTFSQTELLALLEAKPEAFSPNVVMRPQMQDWLFPTVAYVGGPGEVAYFAQFKPVYAWSGLPMPVLYPRASVTLIEPRIQKVLQRYPVQLADFSGDFEQLFQRLILTISGGKVDRAFEDMLRALNTQFDELKTTATQVDASMERAAEATRASLWNELDKLRKRILHAEKRNHDTMRDQLAKAQSALFPDGLQERFVSIVPFLNKYGWALMDKLRQEVSLDVTQHQVIKL